jgi:hypothetical protein
LTWGLVLIGSGFAVGQEVSQLRTVTTTPAGPMTELRRVSQILGSSVRLQDGSGYGRVEDILLSEDGCIEYAVIARENQYALLPWGIANVDYSQRVVSFGVTPQVIQPLFFAPNAWPNLSDPAFGSRMQQAFGPSAVRHETRREALRPVPPGPQVGPAGTPVPSPREPAKAKVKEKR